MVRDKLRIRFRKGGDLRLVSHHDLMRCFERMLRRARLPFHATEGYNPKPRMVFALSLGLGIEGCDEVVELELDEVLPPEEVHDRLVRQAPAGLGILSVRRIEPRAGAQVRSATYRVKLPLDCQAGLSERMTALLASEHCWMERVRPQPRRLDLKPYLRDLRLCAGHLEIDLWVTPTGTARPDEIIKLLELSDVLDAGAVLQRIKLELHDELTPSASAGGLAAPALAFGASSSE